LTSAASDLTRGPKQKQKLLRKNNTVEGVQTKTNKKKQFFEHKGEMPENGERKKVEPQEVRQARRTRTSTKCM